ncbi:hypothetical protein PFISCL1PPCAC_17816, partial [Pristionchus fissidentatus]
NYRGKSTGESGLDPSRSEPLNWCEPQSSHSTSAHLCIHLETFPAREPLTAFRRKQCQSGTSAHQSLSLLEDLRYH